MNIDFKKAVFELSDESFEMLKDLLEPYLWNYFLKKEEITKAIELEKIGEYLKAFEAQKKTRDGDLAYLYASTLLPYVENRISTAKKGNSPCKAERFLERARKLQVQLKTHEEDIDLIGLLEDFTKIFVCLYAECIKDINNKVISINFHAATINIDEMISFFLNDTPALKKLGEDTPEQLKGFIPKGFFKGANDVMKGINDMQKGLQDAQKGIGDSVKKMMRKPDDIAEPVHDFIEYLDENSIYTDKVFSAIILSIFYLRVRDYELGNE